jgi:hypothetical protein
MYHFILQLVAISTIFFSGNFGNLSTMNLTSLPGIYIQNHMRMYTLTTKIERRRHTIYPTPAKKWSGKELNPFGLPAIIYDLLYIYFFFFLFTSMRNLFFFFRWSGYCANSGGLWWMVNKTGVFFCSEPINVKSQLNSYLCLIIAATAYVLFIWVSHVFSFSLYIYIYIYIYQIYYFFW